MQVLESDENKGENNMKNQNITFVKFIKRVLTHTAIQIIYNIQRKEPHFELIFYRNMFDFNLSY